MIEISLATIGWIITIAIFIIGLLATVIGKLKAEVSQKKKEQFDELKTSIKELVDKFELMTQNMVSQNQKIIETLSKYELLSKFIDDHTDELHRHGERITGIDKDIQSMKLNCAANNHRKNLKG